MPIFGPLPDTFGHKRSGSPSPNGLFSYFMPIFGHLSDTFGHERSGSQSPNGLFSYFIFSLCKRGREFSWPSPWVVKEERTGPGNLKFVNPNTNQCPSPKICQKFGAFSEHYCQNVRFRSKSPIFGASENTDIKVQKKLWFPGSVKKNNGTRTKI